MKFKSFDGSLFEMKVVGYEFPELETEHHDSNWLLIQIEASHPRGEWSATDPALLTYEIEWLANWLETLASGDFSKPHMWFTEPCLEFHLSFDDHPEPILQVVFSHEFRPPWASREWREDEEEHLLEFRLSDLNLHHSVQSLHEQLKTFPQRAER
jgi:hypothetical protein